MKKCEKGGCFASVFSLFLHGFNVNRNGIAKSLCLNDLCGNILLRWLDVSSPRVTDGAEL